MSDDKTTGFTCRCLWNRIVGCAMAGVLGLSAVVTAAAENGPAVVFSRTPSELKPYALAVGSRLLSMGKERVSASGTLTYFIGEKPRAETVRVTWHHPMKLRLEGESLRLSFVGGRHAKVPSVFSRGLDVIRTLLEDSVEGFFDIQKEGSSRRYLGSGFKLEGASEAAAGMDVFLLTFPDRFGGNQEIQKSYWFDSATKLLGVVAYRSPSGTATHVVLEDWRTVDGERIPFRVERWEDGKLFVRLTIDSASCGGGVDAGEFEED